MKPAEFARVYYSEERVAYINALPCVACKALGARQRSQSDNHHTLGGGTGRKGPYLSITPLCRDHHMEYHRAGKLTVASRWRIGSWEAVAWGIERGWKQHEEVT